MTHPHPTLGQLPDSACDTLARWHEMVAVKDMSRLPELLADNVCFRSPFAWKPYAGIAQTHFLLSTVITVFEDFTDTRVFESATGCVLEFSARVGDKALFGVDLIEFDADGKIVDFEVMIRPANALQALGAELGKRLAAAGHAAQQS